VSPSSSVSGCIDWFSDVQLLLANIFFDVINPSRWLLSSISSSFNMTLHQSWCCFLSSILDTRPNLIYLFLPVSHGFCLLQCLPYCFTSYLVSPSYSELANSSVLLGFSFPLLSVGSNILSRTITLGRQRTRMDIATAQYNNIVTFVITRNTFCRIRSLSNATFFIFDHVTFIKFKICCCVQNFMKIGWFFTDIWRYIDFQNGGRPPS